MHDPASLRWRRTGEITEVRIPFLQLQHAGWDGTRPCISTVIQLPQAHTSRHSLGETSPRWAAGFLFRPSGMLRGRPYGTRDGAKNTIIRQMCHHNADRHARYRERSKHEFP